VTWAATPSLALPSPLTLSRSPPGTRIDTRDSFNSESRRDDNPRRSDQRRDLDYRRGSDNRRESELSNYSRTPLLTRALQLM